MLTKPISYLFALQQKVHELEKEIKNLTNATENLPCYPELKSPSVTDMGYCLGILNEENSAASTIVHIGPGSSARLMELLIKGTLEWVKINKPLTSTYTLSPLLSFSTAIDGDSGHSFSLFLNEREYESVLAVPPSTQRLLVEHYLKVVQSKYPLLSRDQESLFLQLENPMKWIVAHPLNANSLALTAIFAISMALVARDLDPNLSGSATSFRQSLNLLAKESETSLNNSIDGLKRNTTILCFSAILELVNPKRCNIWETVGRAMNNIQQLRADLHAESLIIGDDFRGLELSLLKIERY
jgi:hypothetical protein